MKEKKISQKALFSAWRIWFFWHGSSQQAESLLGNAFGHTLTPVIKELYADDKEGRIDAYKRSLTLFNTEQQVGAICPGIACGMEEAKANGHVTSDVVSSVKVALIGPSSAIGDSLWVATLIPIFLTICLSITKAAGNFGWIGPLLYMIVYPVGTAIMSWNLWKLGYRTGVDGIHRFMTSGKLDIARQAMTVLGLVVVGALAASFVNMSVPISITPVGGEAAAVNLDALINQIFPKLLPLGLTVFIYWLYSKKKWPPMTIMALVLFIAILLTVVGYLSGVYT
jgi:PTS system mannose-specific IID component